MLPAQLFVLPLSVLVLLLGGAAPLRAQGLRPRVRTVVAPPARKDKFQLYLLIGQSNMAGRGVVEAQDTVPNRHVLRLNPAGQWEVAKGPLHFDKPGAGVGPGMAFGRAMAAQDTSLTIGLIPCAVGGAGLEAWLPGAYFADTQTHPYDDALARARLALAAGTLAGIVWNQGESDTSPAKSANYAPKLRTLIARLRADLQAPAVPFVAGQLPLFPQSVTDVAGVARVNAALAGLRATVPHYACVPATGTTDRGDHLHLDAASARLMGERYAQAMQQLQRLPRRSK
ncbi:MAG: sialate O-acetylesterase [Hymenobacter sp.]|nr:MAG: sialate O-acetylesterase [Hymenobacter sp.]